MVTNIYTLTDPETGMVRYVGKANNISQRYSAHLNKARKHQTHKWNWIQQLKVKGLKPIIEVIDVVPISEWKFWEKFWIQQMRVWGFNLVNHTNGGDGLSFGNQTSFKKGQIPWNKGVPISDELRHKLRVINLGKKLSQETIKKMSDNKIGNPPPYMVNGIPGDVLDKMSKTWFSPGGDPWNKGLTGHKLGGKKKSREVYKLDKENNILEEFLGVKEASITMKCNPEGIRRCCVGKQKIAKGFKWKYKNKLI